MHLGVASFTDVFATAQILQIRVKNFRDNPAQPADRVCIAIAACATCVLQLFCICTSRPCEYAGLTYLSCSFVAAYVPEPTICAAALSAHFENCYRGRHDHGLASLLALTWEEQVGLLGPQRARKGCTNSCESPPETICSMSSMIVLLRTDRINYTGYYSIL